MKLVKKCLKKYWPFLKPVQPDRVLTRELIILLSFFPIDINVVHEAYQFLGMKYVDDTYTAPNTFALLHRTFLKIAKPDLGGKKDLNLVPTGKKRVRIYNFTKK